MKKNKITGNFIGLIVTVVILVLSGVLGNVTGVFEEIGDIREILHFDFKTLLELIIMAAFLFGINALIQIIMGIIPQKSGRISTLATVLSSLVKYAVVLIGFCWGLTIIGVNVSTVFAGVGIIALIIGFGAESLVADLVTGMFLLFENQFNVGDIIELDGYRGTVEFIGIRTTGIRDAGGNIKIVNNSNIKNLLNRSEKGSVAVAEVGVSYATDLREIDKIIPAMLKGIKERNTGIFKGEIKYLGVDNLADSAVVLKFVAEVDEKDIFSGRRLLNKELKCSFDDAGIEIAFPQMDVHMKN